MVVRELESLRAEAVALDAGMLAFLLGEAIGEGEAILSERD
jgi:hypothetical protein